MESVRGETAVPSAHDVARELRRQIRGAGDVRVHKLLYYCQGWHLVWTGERMFSENMQAWANGPVVASLWRAEKHGQEIPEASPVDETRLGTIGYVVSKYGHLTGRDLIRLTHAESPWRIVSERYDEGDWHDQEISDELLVRCFEPEGEDEQKVIDGLLEDSSSAAIIREGLARARSTEGQPDDLGRLKHKLLAR